MKERITVRRLETDTERRLAWPIAHQLRPHLDEAGFLAAVACQRKEGFQVAGAFDGPQCIGFAGYRIQHMLAHGRLLYVDDLITDESRRGQGVGRALIDWLVEQARERQCRSLQLDSGTFRHEAHAFYFARGMRINSFHFSLPLNP